MSGAIRLSLLFALTSVLAGCSLIHIRHCTFWNILPAMGIAYAPDVCPGGIPTFTTPPRFP